MSSIFRRLGGQQGSPKASDTRPADVIAPMTVTVTSQTPEALGRSNEALRRELDAISENFQVVDTIRGALDQVRGALDQSLADLERSNALLRQTETELAAEREAHRLSQDELGSLRRRHDITVTERDTASLRLAETSKSLADLDAQFVQVEAELQTKTQYAGYLERRGEDMAEQHRAAESEISALRRRLVDVDQRLTATEASLSETMIRATVLDAERMSLDQSLQTALVQNQSAARSVAARDTELAELRAEVDRMRNEVLRQENEYHKLSIAMDEVNVRGASEAAEVRVRLDAVQARANLAERLLTEQRQKVRDGAEMIRQLERAAADAIQRSQSLDQRAIRAEEARNKAEEQLRLGGAARDAAIERASSTGKALRVKEELVMTSDRELAEVQVRANALEETLRRDRGTFEARIAQLSAELERERSERAVAEGALEAARRDRVALQRDVASLRTRTTGGESDAQRNTRLPSEIANDVALPLQGGREAG